MADDEIESVQVGEDVLNVDKTKPSLEEAKTQIKRTTLMTWIIRAGWSLGIVVLVILLLYSGFGKFKF